MPIIIRNTRTLRRYILIGPAYGFTKTNRTNLSFDTGYATFEEKLVVGCDASGDLHWLNAIEIIVESVDGKTCKDLLNDSISTTAKTTTD